MSINRIDFGVIAASNEVSHVKAAEDSRPLMDRQNFQTQFNEEVDNQKNSVNQKDDVGQGEMNSDAQEKGITSTWAMEEETGRAQKRRKILFLRGNYLLKKWKRWPVI